MLSARPQLAAATPFMAVKPDLLTAVLCTVVIDDNSSAIYGVSRVIRAGSSALMLETAPEIVSPPPFLLAIVPFIHTGSAARYGDPFSFPAMALMHLGSDSASKLRADDSSRARVPHRHGGRQSLGILA
eukprot:485520-Rhodomonas_salina.6